MFKSRIFLLAVLFVSATRGAVDFYCRFVMGYYGDDENVYTCRAQVKIVGDSQLLENVQGMHVSGKTNDDVKALNVFDQKLPFVPGNITTFYKNLIGLDWWNNNLVNISAADLEPFPNLLYFSVIGNNLISIDGDLFKHTPWLRIIDFRDNQIQHVGHDLIKNLNELVTLYFFNNPCVNAFAWKNRTAVLWLNDQLPLLCPKN